MNLKIKLAPQASKFLTKCVDRKRISAKLKQYFKNGLPRTIIKLTDRPGYRIRVGNYRVLFTIEGKTIYIFKIGKRSNVY